jgi:dTDP-4-amino-4,6-dideoxygalactose transaminase
MDGAPFERGEVSWGGSNMRVKANNFDRMWSDHGPEICNALRVVGESGWYILGQEVRSFEEKLAEYCRTKYAVGCGNGMDALEMSLRALGLQVGQKVLTTPLSAFATTLAIIRAGGVPVFCDVDENGLMDLNCAEDCLAENLDIKFLIPVHLYGHAMDMVRVRDLRERYHIVVIEDAAQAIGAQRNGEVVGSAGHTTCFSFYPTKNLGALGDGGAVVTNDVQIYVSLQQLRNYGQHERYVHNIIGMNSRLDEIHAAILCRVLLPKLPEATKRRQEIARLYCSGLDHHSVEVRPGPEINGSVWHLFPIMVPADKRLLFLGWLRSAGIDADVHYPLLINEQGAMSLLSTAPIVHGSLSRAKEFVSREVSLPINPYLTDQEVEYVIGKVNSWEK